MHGILYNFRVQHILKTKYQYAFMSYKPSIMKLLLLTLSIYKTILLQYERMVKWIYGGFKHVYNFFDKVWQFSELGQTAIRVQSIQ